MDMFHWSTCLCFDDYSKKSWIYFIVSFKCSYSGTNEKPLMKFSFRHLKLNVSPHSFSILYHLFGMSSKVAKNM